MAVRWGTVLAHGCIGALFVLGVHWISPLAGRVLAPLYTLYMGFILGALFGRVSIIRELKANARRFERELRS